MTSIKPNRKGPNGKDVDYINDLSFNGVVLEGTDGQAFKRVDQTMAEIQVLAGQQHTSLMAVRLEQQGIHWVLSNMYTEDNFEHTQYLLNTHRLLHSPIRSQCQAQAELDSMALSADPESFIAGLSVREANYHRYSLIPNGQSNFMTIEDIPTALEELSQEVGNHGFRIKAVYSHYLASKTAFTPEMIVQINRAVGLRCLAGKTAMKQIKTMLKKVHGLSDDQVKSEFAAALGTLEWIKPRDLAFTEAVYDGKITTAALAELRPLEDILQVLISGSVPPIAAKHLCHHPTFILELAKLCGGELATKAAIYASETLMSQKLQGQSGLIPLLEALETYKRDPRVNFNLCMLKRANGLMATDALEVQLKPGSTNAQLIAGLRRVFKSPAELTQALHELQIAIPPAVLRLNGKAFAGDLGM